MKNDNLNITFPIENYLVTILKFSYEQLPKNMPMHAHSSNSYEIHYIPKGHGTLISENKSYDLHPGILCTTGPFVEHAQFIDRRDPVYEYCIYMKIEKVVSSKVGKISKKKIKNALDLFLKYPFWYGEDNAGIETVLEKIRDEFEEPGYAVPVLLEALFTQFIVCILRNYDNVSMEFIKSDPIPVAKTYILIEDSFLYEYATITMKELSKRLGLSIRQTSRVLSDYYGKNFIQMRTEARMAAAVAFLREGNFSISEISNRLGYSCVNHFHAAFKNFYHETIGNYKKKLEERGGEDDL